MDFNTRFAKIVGTPSLGRDSWIITEGKFFLLFDLSLSLPSETIAETGKKIIDELSGKFNQLENKNLAGLKTMAKESFLEESGVLNIILGTESEGIFYLVCQGLGKVLVKRGEKLGIILENEGGVYGPIKPNDLFLFCSTRFLEIVTQEEILRFAQDDIKRPEEMAESLTPLLHRVEDTSGSACLILKFEAKTEEPEPEQVVEVIPGRKDLLRKKIKNFLTFIIDHKPKLRNNHGKRWPILIVFLLMLLILSMVFSYRKQNSDQKQKQFNQVYELTVHQLEQGQALIGLNNSRAVNLLSEAKTNLLNLQKDFKEKSQQVKTIAGLLSQIDQELQAANQIYKVSPEIFFDLNLLKTGGQGNQMGISSGQVYILDQKNNVVYQIDPKTKAGKIISQNDQPKDLKQTKTFAESQNFNTTGLSQPLSKDALVFTNQDTVKSYVWDRLNKQSFSSNKRVVVFDEKNNYQSQYQWSNNENYTSMVVSEEVKEIFLLRGSKIDGIGFK